MEWKKRPLKQSEDEALTLTARRLLRACRAGGEILWFRFSSGKGLVVASMEARYSQYVLEQMQMISIIVCYDWLPRSRKCCFFMCWDISVYFWSFLDHFILSMLWNIVWIAFSFYTWWGAVGFLTGVWVCDLAVCIPGDVWGEEAYDSLCTYCPCTHHDIQDTSSTEPLQQEPFLTWVHRATPQSPPTLTTPLVNYGTVQTRRLYTPHPTPKQVFNTNYYLPE